MDGLRPSTHVIVGNPGLQCTRDEMDCSPCRSPSVMSAPDLSPARTGSAKSQESCNLALEPSFHRTHFQRPESSGYISKTHFEFVPLSLMRANMQSKNSHLTDEITDVGGEGNEVVETDENHDDSLDERVGTNKEISHTLQKASDATHVADSRQGTEKYRKRDSNSIARRAISDIDLTESKAEEVTTDESMKKHSSYNRSDLADRSHLTTRTSAHIHENLNSALTPANFNDLMTEDVTNTTDARDITLVNDPALESGLACKTQHRRPAQQQRGGSHFRVTKPRISRTQQMRISDSSSEIEKGSIHGKDVPDGPSEEDLLLLIMHRYRLKDDETADLRHHSIDMKNQLQEVQLDRDRAVQQYERLFVQHQKEQEKVLQFQARYGKIKTWALNFNHEYATLQQQSIEIRSQILDVKKDRDALLQMVKSNKDLVDQHRSNHDQVGSQVSESRIQTESLERNHDALKRMYDVVNKELQSERALRKKLEVHILHVAKAQSNFDKQTTIQYGEITSLLVKIHTQAQDQKDVSENLISGNQFAALVQSMTQHDETSTASNMQLMAKLDSLLESIVTMSETSVRKEDLQVVVEVDKSFAAGLMSVKQAIEALQPSTASHRVLTEVKCRLEEQLRSAAKVEEILQNDKTVAQQRIATLETSQQQLFSEAVKPRDLGVISLEKALSETQGRCTEFKDKFNETTLVLKQTEEQLAKLLEENKQLREQLHTTVLTQDAALRESEEKYQDQILFLEEELEWLETARFLHQEDEDRDRDREDALGSIQQELSNEEACRAASEQKLEEFQRHNKKLLADFARLQSRISDLEGQVASEESEKKVLRDQVQKMLHDTYKYDEMDKQLVEQADQVTKLRAQTMELSGCKARLAETTTENSRLKHEVAQLSEQLQAGEISRSIATDLESKLSSLLSQSNDLRGELELSKAKADEVKCLREELTQMNDQLAKVTYELDVAQSHISKVNAVRVSKSTDTVELEAQLIQNETSIAGRLSAQDMLELSQSSIQLSLPSINVPDSQIESEHFLRQHDRDSQPTSKQDLVEVGIDPWLTILPEADIRTSRHAHKITENSLVPALPPVMLSAPEVDKIIPITNALSSPLSELTDLADDDIPVLVRPSLRAPQRQARSHSHAREGDPTSQPASLDKSDYMSHPQLTNSLRPVSAASQEIMLLETTPQTYSHGHRTDDLCRTPLREHRICQPSLKGQQSHEKFRFGLQTSPADDDDMFGSSNACAASSHRDRERHRPNSAVKRRYGPPDHSHPPEQKRLKRKPENLSLQIPAPSKAMRSSKTSVPLSSKETSSISAGNRNKKLVDLPTAAGLTQRRNNRGNGKSKTERYAQRFGGAERE